MGEMREGGDLNGTMRRHILLISNLNDKSRILTKNSNGETGTIAGDLGGEIGLF